MHDLVGVAAEDEAERVAQGFEREVDLDVGQVLHLVNHREVVRGPNQVEMVEGCGVQVEQPFIGHPAPVFFENIVDQRPLIVRENGAAHAQVHVSFAGQKRTVYRGAGEHAVEFLEEHVRVLDRV